MSSISIVQFIAQLGGEVHEYQDHESGYARCFSEIDIGSTDETFNEPAKSRLLPNFSTLEPTD